MSAIRSIVFQYFVYLEELVGSFSSDSWRNAYSSAWKVLDADYVALEFGYITHALGEAALERGIIEVQEGGCAYVLQFVEDTFFVLQRVLERSLSTGDDSCIFGVSNKIVEMLDPQRQPELYTAVCGIQRYKGLFASGSLYAHRPDDPTPSDTTAEDDDGKYHTGVGAMVSGLVGSELAGVATGYVISMLYTIYY
jgi:COG4 transport protein